MKNVQGEMESLVFINLAIFLGDQFRKKTVAANGHLSDLWALGHSVSILSYFQVEQNVEIISHQFLMLRCHVNISS